MPSRESTTFLTLFFILCVLALQNLISIDLSSLILSFESPDADANIKRNDFGIDATSNATTMALMENENTTIPHATDSFVSNMPQQTNDSVSIRDFEYYRKHRFEQWDSWFDDQDEVKDNADANGTILDFVIAGFAKCGTTTMEGNLGALAPMPLKDVCTPLANTISYAYRNWPKAYPDKDGRNDTKLYRGTKCPVFVHNLSSWSRNLPRTLIIVGIRHPVLWFQSFWNMQAQNFPHNYKNSTPYDRTKICSKCQNKGCPRKQLFCVARSRFHLVLANLGKTPLDSAERALLAPNDGDGGDNIKSQDIRNTIFLYEQTELDQEDVWQTLARLLQYPHATIPHDQRHSSHGKKRDYETNTIDICNPKFDAFRGIMMPYAYEMSIWFCDYFLKSPDVVVANRTRFCSIVKDYVNDPCQRLVRLGNGTYILKEGADVNSTTSRRLRRKWRTL